MSRVARSALLASIAFGSVGCRQIVGIEDLVEASPSCSDVPDKTLDAMAIWLMDEGQGQTVRDTSGNCHPLVLGEASEPDEADPAWNTSDEEGCVAPALRFDGDQVATIPSLKTDGASWTAISVAVTVSMHGDDDNEYSRLVSRETLNGQDDFLLTIDSSGRFAASLVGANGSVACAAANTDMLGNLIDWTKRRTIVMTYDDDATAVGGKEVRLYVDGYETQYLETFGCSRTMDDTLVWPANDWYVGNEVSGAYGFRGTIDSLWIYDRALTADEALGRAIQCQ